ncbi:MAG: response regulator [Pseudomonadales bacterium]|nr:response regulator [Pseudomonadales bacterium]
MTKFQILPYFHPSTVVFVDDNNSFLESLKLRLPPSMADEMFSDPRKALNFLNATPAVLPLADRCFSLYEQAGIPGNTAIYLDLSLIEQEISRSSRFQRPSVVVVDYDMPMMNGLEFCKKIEGKEIRRILLTGVADEKIAIEAFNAGLIDRFIRKNHDQALETIFTFISQLQSEYFGNLVSRLKASLAMQSPEYLNEPIVCDYLAAQLNGTDVIEYYMVADPPGFLLLNSVGDVTRLIIQNSEQMAQDIQYAVTHNAPQRIITKMKQNDVLAYFYQRIESHGDESYPWDDFLFSSQRINSSDWHVAFMENPPIDIEYQAGQSSYDSYLKKMDERS